jgi:hypothetical protein
MLAIDIGGSVLIKEVEKVAYESSVVKFALG